MKFVVASVGISPHTHSNVPNVGQFTSRTENAIFATSTSFPPSMVSKSSIFVMAIKPKSVEDAKIGLWNLEISANVAHPLERLKSNLDSRFTDARNVDAYSSTLRTR